MAAGAAGGSAPHARPASPSGAGPARPTARGHQSRAGGHDAARTLHRFAPPPPDRSAHPARGGAGEPILSPATAGSRTGPLGRFLDTVIVRVLDSAWLAGSGWTCREFRFVSWLVPFRVASRRGSGRGSRVPWPGAARAPAAGTGPRPRCRSLRGGERPPRSEERRASALASPA